MKVLVLLSRIPWPLEKGDKLRAYHHIKEISKKHKVVLVCLSDSSPNKNALENLSPYCEEIHFVRLSRLGIFWNLILSVFNDKPFQVNYFYQKSAQKKVDRIIEKHLPKHLYVQLIRTAEYVKKYHVISSTFDYMDAFSMGAQRRIDKAIPGIKAIFTLEAKRLKRYENYVFNQFTHKTIISETDRDLIEHPDKTEIVIVPNGVDFSNFKPDANVDKQYDIVFTGNMNYPPNIKAAQYLSGKVVPLIKVNYPNIKVALAGANPHSSVKRLASSNIVVTGWMDEITEAYNQSKIFIAPMQIGTGMQNKILEAMAMGVPCITTSLAANAIGGTHENNMIVANTPEEFAKWTSMLLEDVELYQRIALNAKEFVHNNYDWAANSIPLLRLIESEG